MDSKTKRNVIVASMVLVVIVGVLFFYNISSTKNFEFRTGGYFYKANIINKGSSKNYKWDIGISKNNSKKGVVEDESNIESLEKFRDTIEKISGKKFEVFSMILYLLFILVIIEIVRKDSQILKAARSNKIFKLFVTILVIFLICKISISFVELNNLYKNINFYFGLIS